MLTTGKSVHWLIDSCNKFDIIPAQVVKIGQKVISFCTKREFNLSLCQDVPTVEISDYKSLKFMIHPNQSSKFLYFSQNANIDLALSKVINSKLFGATEVSLDAIKRLKKSNEIVDKVVDLLQNEYVQKAISRVEKVVLYNVPLSIVVAATFCFALSLLVICCCAYHPNKGYTRVRRIKLEKTHSDTIALHTHLSRATSAREVSC